MAQFAQLDLYTIIHEMTGVAEWIREIYVFGSRRYASNSSYGSDIDLIFVPDRDVSIAELRELCTESYIDPFLLDHDIAISAANESRIPVRRDDAVGMGIDAVQIWTREEGWKSGAEYRIIQIIPDRNPAATVSSYGASPVVIFCALPKEFEAVRKLLPDGKFRSGGGVPAHYVSHISGNSGRKRLVIVAQTGVASVAAGIAAARMLEYFAGAEMAILVGITAGVRGRGAELGDILLPKASIDVEAGKVTPKGKEPAGLSISVDSSVHSAIACWPGKAAWTNKWKTTLSGRETTPQIHDDCTLACTASVIAYDQQAQTYCQQNRKIAGIEMEAVGIGTAVQRCCPFLIVKSISDWADHQKDDRWHTYCAEIAADLVITALREEII